MFGFLKKNIVGAGKFLHRSAKHKTGRYCMTVIGTTIATMAGGDSVAEYIPAAVEAVANPYGAALALGGMFFRDTQARKDEAQMNTGMVDNQPRIPNLR